jgi:tRNA (guanine-N7-)-methyltransferase
MTPAQTEAIRSLWPRYGLDWQPRELDLDTVFGRAAPRVLEIGFGNGDALLALAAARPDQDFIGVEVHRPGAGSLMRRAAQSDLDNLRVSTHDAIEVLEQQIPDASLAAVHLFFPDPWPKKRHHKRRIVQPGFVHTIANKLADGGILHMATDWAPYAEWMTEVMDAATAFTGGATERPATRPLTRFEQRGERLGHAVTDLIFTRRARS